MNIKNCKYSTLKKVLFSKHIIKDIGLDVYLKMLKEDGKCKQAIWREKQEIIKYYKVETKTPETEEK